MSALRKLNFFHHRVPFCDDNSGSFTRFIFSRLESNAIEYFSVSENLSQCNDWVLSVTAGFDLVKDIIDENENEPLESFDEVIEPEELNQTEHAQVNEVINEIINKIINDLPTEKEAFNEVLEQETKKDEKETSDDNAKTFYMTLLICLFCIFFTFAHL